MHYTLEVYFEINENTAYSVFTFDTDKLDFIYRILGNNTHWVTDDHFNYLVYDNTFEFAVGDDNVLFCK